MIFRDKLEKIRTFKNDDSDLIEKINKYLIREFKYTDKDDVFHDLNELKGSLDNYKKMSEVTVFSFCKEDNIISDCKKIDRAEFESACKSSEEASYYSGETYNEKMLKYQGIAEKYADNMNGTSNAIFILDVSSISSFPLWNTTMRRKMHAIVEEIEKTSKDDITGKWLHNTIMSVKPVKNTEDDKYDLDILISVMKAVAEKVPIKAYFYDNMKTNESIFFVNELKKFVYALGLDKLKRYDYIYDTVCDDMDEMFSSYGFCNFKANKCVSQRHKNLFNRYPVPKTDGCCFKVVRKCEHNNKDGTCKVRCLPCKLFTCPFLGKISIGIRTSELILFRSFFNNKQKRISLYKFYNSKEVLLSKIIDAI